MVVEFFPWLWLILVKVTVYHNFFLELFLASMSDLMKKKRGMGGWTRSNFEHITLVVSFGLRVFSGCFLITRENFNPKPNPK